jgi:PTH1 family peptidyl-tRNA hydrolase
MAHFFRLIVGLGNPGRQYANTRHNIGFTVLDRLADRRGASFREDSKWGAAVARSGDLILCKPMRFMNCSGGAARAVADFFKVSAGDLLVVLDDFALPLGRLRLRGQGSAGGHNGLDSILGAFGTDAIPRLRIGIGAVTQGGMADHVLGRFSAEEADEKDAAVARAADAVGVACEEGLTAAMNQFNKTEDTTT